MKATYMRSSTRPQMPLPLCLGMISALGFFLLASSGTACSSHVGEQQPSSGGAAAKGSGGAGTAGTSAGGASGQGAGGQGAGGQGMAGATGCSPESLDNAGIQAPVEAGAIKRTICKSGCDYSTIKAAFAAAKPGWTLQLRAGTYKERVYLTKTWGAEGKPISLVAYPGEAPVWDNSKDPSLESQLTVVTSGWLLVDGITFRNSFRSSIDIWDGSGHITIQNCRIENSQAMGMFVVNSNHILIQKNSFINNGTLTGKLHFKNGHPIKHHIYISHSDRPSPHTCTGVDSVTIRNNWLERTEGMGVHVNGLSCVKKNSPKKIRKLVFANNIVVDGSSGFSLHGGITESRYVNNTIILRTWLKPTLSRPSAMILNAQVTKTIVANNIFYTSASDGAKVHGYWSWNSSGFSDNAINYNLYRLTNTEYSLGGSVFKKDFEHNFSNETGYGTKDLCCNVDPRFVNVPTSAPSSPQGPGKLDVALKAGSPAIDAANPIHCPEIDFRGIPRTCGGVCDLGAMERMAE